MNASRTLLIALLVITSGLLAATLGADDSNYRNFLLGDRAAGMGGAVVATTNDADACYYNPAGLARISGSRIALSVNLYGIQEIRIREGLGKGETFRAREFVSIPSTFTSILKVSDDLALAFSIFTPDKVDLNVRHTFAHLPDTPGVRRSDYYTATFRDDFLWIGPSIGWRVGNRLQLGGGVYLLYRSALNNQQWANLYAKEETGELDRLQVYTQNIEFRNWALLGLMGAQYDLSEEFALGATIQTSSLNLTGSGEILYAVSIGDPERDILLQARHLKSRNYLPTQLTLGAAWRRPKLFTVEVDCSYHLPTEYIQLSGQEATTGEPVASHLRREGVVNFSLGGEYYLSDHYPLRAGIFTNLSSAPRLDPDKLDRGRDQVDMYGVSASISNESEHTVLTLGVNYVWGRGKTVGSGENLQPLIVDQSQYQLFVFLSSAYLF